MREPKEKPNASFRVPKGAGLKMTGFKDLSVDETVTITIKGKVKEISDRGGESWDPGQRFEVQMSSCKIQGPAKKTSIGDAIKASQSKV